MKLKEDPGSEDSAELIFRSLFPSRGGLPWSCLWPPGYSLCDLGQFPTAPSEISLHGSIDVFRKLFWHYISGHHPRDFSAADRDGWFFLSSLPPPIPVPLCRPHGINFISKHNREHSLRQGAARAVCGAGEGEFAERKKKKKVEPWSQFNLGISFWDRISFFYPITNFRQNCTVSS